MPKKYRSPTSRSAVAAAAPARLAEECGGQALWRDRSDGELEVATVREGWLYRYLVHEDGTTTLIESVPPLSSHFWARPLSYAGFGLCVATLIVLLLIGDSGGGEAFGRALPFFLTGMALVAIGAIASVYESDIEKRLRRRRDAAGQWHEAAKLNGWAPQTSAQLAAVERLADEHKGVAHVRDVGGRTVDVVVRHRGRLERYWVDQSGRTELAESAWPSTNDLALQAAAFAWFPLFVSVFFVVTSVHGGARGPLIAGLATAGLVTLAIRIRLRPSGDGPYRGTQRVEDDGVPWFEVRTIEEDTD